EDARDVLALGVAGVGLLVLGAGAASHALDREALAQNRERLQYLLETGVDGMAIERDGVIGAVNEVLAELTGADRQALIGSDLEAWVQDARRRDDGAVTQSALMVKGKEIPDEIAAPHDDT